jgi:nicotinamidase-related amidase
MELRIDPKKTALVIIDLQKGIAGIDRQLAPHSASEVIENASKIAKAFRSAGALVVPVHVASRDGKDMLHPVADQQPWSGSRSPDFAEFVPELEVGKNDHPVTKLQWGAFYGTDLDLQLRRRSIDTIVLCGISTNIGVESTARDAYQHGYNQIFVEDAMTAMSNEEHESSVRFIFPRIGLVRKTEEVLQAIAK